MNQIGKSLIIVLLIFATLGCIGAQSSTRKIEYYTLEYLPPSSEALNPLPLSLLIKRFRVDPLYNSTKIIYRDQKFKRTAYHYHKWRVPPGDLVTYLLARDMRTAGLFKAIFTANPTIPATHIVEGTVDEFFEKDSANAWEAVLKVGITLIVKDQADISQSILLHNTYSATAICSQKNPRSLAAAMSRAMQRVSEMILKDLYDRLGASRF